MPKYIVTYTKIYEVHMVGTAEVEANNKDEARRLAMLNTPDDEDSEYDSDSIYLDYTVRDVEEAE